MVTMLFYNPWSLDINEFESYKLPLFDSLGVVFNLFTGLWILYTVYTVCV